MKNTENTADRGSYRWILFYDTEDKTWYGVALEFNIVVSGDTQIHAFSELKEAVDGYLECAQDVKELNDFAFLNQEPDPDYTTLWHLLQHDKEPPTDYKIGDFGVCPYIFN